MEHIIIISFFIGVSLIVYFIKNNNNKIIEFKHSKTIEITSKISKIELEKLLLNISKKDQLNISIPNENEYESKNMLIQKNILKNNNFFVCYSQAFGMTEWENKNKDEMLKLIMDLTNNSDTVEIEYWNLIKRAEEGKSFGEY